MQKTKIACLKTWVEISKSALQSNVKIFRNLVKSKTKVMAVIKSNAYGHGLKETALGVQSQVDWFGVDSLEEGTRLRQAGITKPILVLGFIRPLCIKQAVENGLSFVAYEPTILQELKKLSTQGVLKKYPAKLHLKVETGTVRQGLNGKALLDFAKSASKIQGVRIEGIYTHFANIEDTTDHTFADLQLKRLLEEKDRLAKAGIKPEITHAGCTAAALLFADTHLDMIRLGIGLYGLWSSKETQAVAQKMHLNIKFKPALTWKTIIAQIKNVPKGTAISYGLTEHVTRPSKIAILPVGYWDGYDRGLSGSGHAIIRGTRCKVVGRICMNMLMVDVTDVKGVKVQDEAVLLGSQKKEKITAEEMASKISTINYEVITRINPLIPRILI
ncbi:MAG: alanine racemase [Patescibacteria group bacterium]